KDVTPLLAGASVDAGVTIRATSNAPGGTSSLLCSLHPSRFRCGQIRSLALGRCLNRGELLSGRSITDHSYEQVADSILTDNTLNLGRGFLAAAFSLVVVSMVFPDRKS